VIISSATPIDHATQLAGPTIPTTSATTAPTTALGAICATDCARTSTGDSTPRSSLPSAEEPGIFPAGAALSFDIFGHPCAWLASDHPTAGRWQASHPVAGDAGQMIGVGKDCQQKDPPAIGPATQVARGLWLTPQTRRAGWIFTLSEGLVGYFAADYDAIAQFGWLCSSVGQERHSAMRPGTVIQCGAGDLSRQLFLIRARLLGDA
jgi:hypothetical protein